MRSGGRLWWECPSRVYKQAEAEEKQIATATSGKRLNRCRVIKCTADCSTDWICPVFRLSFNQPSEKIKRNILPVSGARCRFPSSWAELFISGLCWRPYWVQQLSSTWTWLWFPLRANWCHHRSEVEYLCGEDCGCWQLKREWTEDLYI